jgi:hypothetical protein
LDTKQGGICFGGAGAHAFEEAGVEGGAEAVEAGGFDGGFVPAGRFGEGDLGGVVEGEAADVVVDEVGGGFAEEVTDGDVAAEFDGAGGGAAVDTLGAEFGLGGTGAEDEVNALSAEEDGEFGDFDVEADDDGDGEALEGEEVDGGAGGEVFFPGGEVEFVLVEEIAGAEDGGAVVAEVGGGVVEGAGAEDDGLVGASEGAGEEGEFVFPEEGGEGVERGVGLWEKGFECHPGELGKEDEVGAGVPGGGDFVDDGLGASARGGGARSDVPGEEFECQGVGHDLSQKVRVLGDSVGSWISFQVKVAWSSGCLV